MYITYLFKNIKTLNGYILKLLLAFLIEIVISIKYIQLLQLKLRT